MENAQCVCSEEKGVTIRELTHSSNGYKLNKPITIELPAGIGRGEEDVYNYIIESLLENTPNLIPFACRNQSLFEMAKYLRRGLTSSRYTLRNYVWSVCLFCRWTGREPDDLIRECKDADSLPNLKKIEEHSKLIDDFIGGLKADGLAPCTISSYVKGVKTFYSTNKLEPKLPYKLRRVVKYEDRAPKPEELQKVIDLADLRDKVIVLCLALGGFRIGTLAKLKYRHIRDDLEKGIIPIHVHVEAEITKGKYHDYDTFLGREAVEYIKAYLDARRRGTMREYHCSDGYVVVRGIPPEVITDESPIIRNKHRAKVTPVTPKQIYNTVHALYRKAGVISSSSRRRYKLRAHSIRKFFRTQLSALGVDRDYIEYMMGHTISTYHDIDMKGIEFIRGIYVASGLSIRPKTSLSKIEALKEIVRAWGLDPEKVLTREALSEPHRAIVGNEEDQVKALSRALKDMMRKELLSPEDK